MKRKIFGILFALVLVLSLSLVPAVPVSAATITAVVPIDIPVGPVYTALAGPTIAEDSVAEIQPGQIILTAETGFEFDTGSNVTATVTVGDLKLDTGLTFQTVTPLASTITIDVFSVSTAASTIEYSGIEIRDTDNVAGTTGSLDFSGGAGVTGSAGTLTSVPGALNNFLVEAEGGGNIGTQTAGTAFLIQITARDQYNNTLNDGINFFDGVGNTVEITSNVTISAGGGTSGDFTAGVLNNHSMTLTEASAAATITATDSVGGLGTNTEAGTSIAFTVTATANFVPNTGPVGTTIAVTGTGWATGGENIDAVTGVTVGGAAATHTLTVVGGNLSGDITVPTLTGGSKTITITGSVSGLQTFASAFTVTAAAAFNPISGFVGTSITVTGTGWAASETINPVTVGGAAATHTLTVDGSGNLSGNITVPTLTVGLKDITITGSASHLQTFASAFTVIVPSGGGGGVPPPDTTPPSISGISASNITGTGADISWKTNEWSTSQVEYRSSPGTLSPLDETMCLDHLVHLTGLTPGTTYHYKTMSTDSAGNLEVSDEDTFATLGEAPAADFTASDLSVSPSEVNIGETVTISVLVANTGNASGSYEVTLKINGVAEATKEVTVDAGASKEVTFTTAKDVAGSNSVAVNGLSGSFTVKEPVPTPAPPPAPPPEVKAVINWPLVGGIIAAAVVVVGLLIFFLVVRRRA